MNWKSTETEQPPVDVPVLTFSETDGTGYGMRAERLCSVVWHRIEGNAVWHNGESWTGDIYFDRSSAPQFWHPLPNTPVSAIRPHA